MCFSIMHHHRSTHGNRSDQWHICGRGFGSVSGDSGCTHSVSGSKEEVEEKGVSVACVTK